LGNQVVLKLLNAGDAKQRKRRGTGTSIPLKKTVNLFDITMNGKKDKRKIKGPINVETKMNMKKSLKANTTPNMKMNMKQKVNAMLQMER
jgi:hypothetical protein